MSEKFPITLYDTNTLDLLLNDSVYTFKLLLEKNYSYSISGKLKSMNLSKEHKAILTVDFITNEITPKEYQNYGLSFSDKVGIYRYIYALNDDAEFHVKLKSYAQHEVLCSLSSWNTNEKLYISPELTITKNEIEEIKINNHVTESSEYNREEILEIFKKSIAEVDIVKNFDIFHMNKKIINYPVFAIALGTSNINPFIFCPRKGLDKVELSVPIDWNMDPFNDTNWKFQFHAWRMVGKALFTFEQNKDVSLVDKVMLIVSDWYRFSIIEGRENDFTWSDMATGIRASVLAYLVNRMLREDSPRRLTTKERTLLFDLIKVHIEKLLMQKLANSNHGIFQMHGLVLLADCFSSKGIQIEGIKKYAYDNMRELFRNQFYFDGMQSENSDEYHRFMVYVFSNIIDASLYKQLHDEMHILNKAKENNDYLLFPNAEGIMIGDTGYFKAKSKRKTEKVRFFRNSGYLYCNETESSMLFITSAFKNVIHKHADHFNFLWYEDDMNILVDAGKYTYNKCEKREYYTSSRAHNVIVIDDQSYMVNTDKYFSTALKYCKKEDYGYSMKLAKYWDEFGVEHNRYYLYKPESFLIIIDVLNSKKEHKYQQVFHLNETLVVEKKDGFHTTKLNSKYLTFSTKTLKEKCITSLVRGQNEPEIQGWRSINYNEEVPNIAIINEVHAKSEVFVTEFLLHDKDEINSPYFEVTKDSAEVKIETLCDKKKIKLIVTV